MLEQFDIWRFLAGLGVFLFGIYYIEESLKSLVGREFKKFLRTQTTNPIKGILGGTLVTAILQSSSVVSLMVLAFVGAGILSLKNAIGIIFGTNLGTTFTGWIVATLGFKVDIASFALPMIAIGGLSLIVFNNSPKLKEQGRFLFGFGFLFIGLDWMKECIDYLANTFDLTTYSDVNIYIFAVVGFIITAIIQSSSAAMVITLSALNSGIISLEAAASFVVGSNLGTTITVMLGAINGTPSKMQVATSHFLFNLFASTVAIILLHPVLNFIQELLNINDSLLILVCFHSAFNLLAILLLLPFLGLFSKLLLKMFNKPSSTNKYLHNVPSEVPEAAIEAIKNEVYYLSEKAIVTNAIGLKLDLSLFGNLKSYYEPKKSYEANYDDIKQLESEIVQYYLDVQGKEMSKIDSDQLNKLIHAIRNLMQSVKAIKDIKHNLENFQRSSNDSKLGLYKLLNAQLLELYMSFVHLLTEGKNSTLLEHLLELRSKNHIIYEKLMKEAYKQIHAQQLINMDISDMLNVNREIYTANQNLIFALKNLLLTVEEANDFNKVPHAH